MNRSRRMFVAGTAGGAAALVLSACGGGGSYSQMAAAPVAPPPPAPPPAPAPAAGASTLSCGATTISANHGHALTIPSTDVDSPVAIVYSIAGSADHNHLVTVTPQQFAQIRNKTAVLVISTIGGDGHLHEVTINCA